eukprot:PITA_26678
MSFRLTNAPVTFMRLVDDILRPFTNAFMVVYLDDILIFNESWEEHFHYIRKVLQTLRQHKLCAKLEKCTFGLTQVQYLGYIIDEFVLGFSHITWPLSQVTKGRAKEKFFWLETQQQAFSKLKNRLCSAPMLTLPNLQQPFEIETDASDYAIGVVLIQQGHPLAYHSETLSDTI